MKLSIRNCFWMDNVQQRCHKLTPDNMATYPVLYDVTLSTHITATVETCFTVLGLLRRKTYTSEKRRENHTQNLDFVKVARKRGWYYICFSCSLGYQKFRSLGLGSLHTQRQWNSCQLEFRILSAVFYLFNFLYVNWGLFCCHMHAHQAKRITLTWLYLSGPVVHWADLSGLRNAFSWMPLKFRVAWALFRCLFWLSATLDHDVELCQPGKLKYTQINFSALPVTS